MPMSREKIKAAVAVLRKGGLVVFPTETLYGLAADALNQKAVDRLVTVKDREEGKPVALIAPDRETVLQLVESVSDYSLGLMEKHYRPPTC